jgi:hypothetical protein
MTEAEHSSSIKLISVIVDSTVLCWPCPLYQFRKLHEPLNGSSVCRKACTYTQDSKNPEKHRQTIAFIRIRTHEPCLRPGEDEIIGNHQCEFRRNRSTFDQIFCVRQIVGKKFKHNETVHQLFIDLKKAHDSVRREALYNILIEFGVLLKLVTMIKMFLNEIYSKVLIGKQLSDNFPIQTRCFITTSS